MSELSAAQIRSARAVLNWSREDLASATNISGQTIFRIENGAVQPRDETLHILRTVFENNGLEFLPNDGVARRRDNISVLTGGDALNRFLNEVYETVKDKGGSICVSGVDELMFDKFYVDQGQSHSQRMTEIKDKIDMRVILREGDYNFTYSSYITYRWMPKEQFESMPFYLYGNKLAIIKFSNENGPEIFIINSPPIAATFKKQFDFIWERCRDVPKKKKDEASS